MKRYIKLPVRLELIQHPQQAVFAICLGIDAIRDWCLGLTMLEEGLVDAFVVSPVQGGYNLDLRISASSNPQMKIEGNLGKDAVSLRLTPTNIDYLLRLGLTYYRDGYAEIDHVDLEGSFAELGNEDVYITFKFADFAPPVSSEEAKKRLED